MDNWDSNLSSNSQMTLIPHHTPLPLWAPHPREVNSHGCVFYLKEESTECLVGSVS